MKGGHMLLHRLVVDMVATDEGDMIVEVETQGEPPFVVALGILDMSCPGFCSQYWW